MKNSLIERLEEILVQAQGKPVSVSTLIQKLAKRGYAALIVLFSLPFCLPIQIPGLSTPFGIILMFIGLRIAFGKRIWLPQKFLSQTIPYDVLSKIATFLKKMLYKLRFFLGTRWTFLTQNPALQIVNGLLVATLAFLMALPLPIPLPIFYLPFL